MPARQRIMMISTHGYVDAEPELGKPDTGGQVLYVLELSKCLGRLGYHVDIYTRRFERQPRAERVAERIRIVRVPCGGREFVPKETLCEHIPEWVRNTLNLMRTKKISYTFINSHYWDAGLAGQSLSNQLQVPHLHTPHSIGAWKRDNMDGDAAALERKYNFKKRIREEKVVYDECDALIATTRQQQQILEGSEYDAPAGKIFNVPPGYDDTRFFPIAQATRLALKREHGFDGRVVLALGRMAHNKGYDLLLKAMPIVFGRLSDAKLILAVGSTDPSPREREQIAELRQLAAHLGIGERVVFRDYIPDAELPDYYRMADVFALSSRYEPFGMTAVEAMACGTPTVVTTEGGLWAQLTYGLEALYANPFDPESFGHALCAVLQYPQLTGQLAKYGSQKARAHFTWMGVAQQIIRVIQGFRMQASARRRPQEKRREQCKEEAFLLAT